jgi:hypothetical protein
MAGQVFFRGRVAFGAAAMLACVPRVVATSQQGVSTPWAGATHPALIGDPAGFKPKQLHFLFHWEPRWYRHPCCQEVVNAPSLQLLSTGTCFELCYVHLACAVNRAGTAKQYSSGLMIVTICDSTCSNCHLRASVRACICNFDQPKIGQGRMCKKGAVKFVPSRSACLACYLL